jgi:hypothetical protein
VDPQVIDLYARGDLADLPRSNGGPLPAGEGLERAVLRLLRAS